MDQLEERIRSILLSRPMPFRIGEERMVLYPETLGSSVLISGLMETMEVDQELMSLNPAVECMRLCTVHPDEAAEVITIATLPGEDCLDYIKVSERRTIILNNCDRDDLSELLLLVLTRSQWQQLIKELGLTEEQEEQSRIAALKMKKSGTRQYGGKSVFGTLLDNACSRYGWTDRYVIWEAPLDRLRMMLADSVTSVLLSDEEKRALNMYDCNEMIDGDSADIETLRSLTRN